MKEIRKYGVKHIEYGSSGEMSHAVGASGRNVFAICDKGFAEAITKEKSSGSQNKKKSIRRGQ